MESNHVRDLMEAYSSIYTENEEVEQLDEFAPGLQGPVDRFLKRGQEVLGKYVRINTTPKGTPTKKDQERKINQNQSFDLFDIIKGHLLDEGFADTEEAALAIMTNMSEEWRKQILDEANEIMSITSPEGKRKKVNRTYLSARANQNKQNARKLSALQKKQDLNPKAMGPRAARRQATDEVETNTRKSISRLNAAKNIEDKQADGDYENSIDHSKPYGKGKSGYMEVPTDYRARRRRASGR